MIRLGFTRIIRTERVPCTHTVFVIAAENYRTPLPCGENAVVQGYHRFYLSGSRCMLKEAEACHNPFWLSSNANIILATSTRCRESFVHVVLPSGESRNYACVSKFERVIIDGS